MSLRLPVCWSLPAIYLWSLLALSAGAQEWSRFRGPNGTGESEAQTIPATWTDADYNWKIELPGVGHSSPSLWGDRIFLLSADPKTATRYVLCYNAADGKQLWRKDYPTIPHHLHVRSSYGSCTPAVDAERMYVAWSDPEHTLLLALDHNGQELWKQDFGPWISQHGYGTSPMLYGDLVVITVSQEISKRAGDPAPKESFVVACDRKTGEVRWKTPCKVDTTSYSVPCLRQNEQGQDELVLCSTGEGLFGLDPQTGKINWSQKVFTMRTVSSPLLKAGLIFGTTGSGGGGNYVVALQPGPAPKVMYEIKKEAPYVPTPVCRGDLMFLWSDKGIVTCINAADGTEVWKQRLNGVSSGFSGSPVRVADKLYCMDEGGTVFVLAADKKFQELGRIELKEESRSTPSVAGGRMYLRTISHLYSIGGKST